MERTLTLADIKGLTAHDLLQEAVQDRQPLIVTLEDGRTVAIQEYQSQQSSEQATQQSSEQATQQSSEQATEQALVLEPLPQFSMTIPEGWKDDLYADLHRH